MNNAGTLSPVVVSGSNGKNSTSAVENSNMISTATANDAVCNDKVEINKENQMSAKISALNHLNEIMGFDAHNSNGYIIRLIVDKGERARLLDEISICQNILKECFENGCIDEGLRLNGVLGHACAVLATATNSNGVQVA